MAQPAISINNDLRPAYYDSFHCLAGDCRWNCCKGWRITFDKKDYLSLKHDKYSPALGEQIGNGIQRIRGNQPYTNHYAEIHLREDGSCPFQREDGLCALQVEKGAQALPEVCKIFPRVEAYLPSGYCERSLSLACEAVVKLLWDLPDGIVFRSSPLPKEKQKTLSFSSDAKTMPYFQEIRSVLIDYLQDRRFPLPARILMAGLAIQELQTAEDIPRWLAYARTLPENPDTRHLLETEQSGTIPRMVLTNNIHVLMHMQSSDPQARSLYSELLRMLKTQVSNIGSMIRFDTTAYLAAREKFTEVFTGHDYFMENIMVSLFFHLHLPSSEDPWKSYVNFCNLYSFFRFLSIFSCREGITDEKEELFRLVVTASRSLLHNSTQQAQLRDELFANDSTTLAHMAVLLSM